MSSKEGLKVSNDRWSIRKYNGEKAVGRHFDVENVGPGVLYLAPVEPYELGGGKRVVFFPTGENTFAVQVGTLAVAVYESVFDETQQLECRLQISRGDKVEEFVAESKCWGTGPQFEAAYTFTDWHEGSLKGESVFLVLPNPFSSEALQDININFILKGGNYGKTT